MGGRITKSGGSADDTQKTTQATTAEGKGDG